MDLIIRHYNCCIDVSCASHGPIPPLESALLEASSKELTLSAFGISMHKTPIYCRMYRLTKEPSSLCFQEPTLCGARSSLGVFIERFITYHLAPVHLSPGLTSKGGRLPDDVGPERAVAVQAEGKEHACAVGLTKMSTAEIKSVNKGIGIDNIHVRPYCAFVNVVLPVYTELKPWPT